MPIEISARREPARQPRAARPKRLNLSPLPRWMLPAGIAAHDVVTKGLTARQFKDFTASFRIIKAAEVLLAIGVSERTAQRIKPDRRLPLDAQVSDRVLRLAKVRALAARVLGSDDAAERWMLEPALGLEGRRPIDLVSSTEGAALINQFLLRIDHGIYA